MLFRKLAHNLLKDYLFFESLGILKFVVLLYSGNRHERKFSNPYRGAHAPATAVRTDAYQHTESRSHYESGSVFFMRLYY